MAIDPRDFIPLVQSGKRDPARRYINLETGQTISRRAYETAAGKMQHRPSSHRDYLPPPKPTPGPQQAEQRLERGKLGKKLSRYSADIRNYARKYGMTPGQARRDPRFKELNREFGRLLKQWNRVLNEEAAARRERRPANRRMLEKKLPLQERLGELARQIGRKDANDFTPFGETPPA